MAHSSRPGTCCNGAVLLDRHQIIKEAGEQHPACLEGDDVSSGYWYHRISVVAHAEVLAEFKEPGERTCSKDVDVCSPVSVVVQAEKPSEFRLDLQKRVTFAPQPSFFTLEPRNYCDLVGDIRDVDNPNFCAMGLARSIRLAQFATEFVDAMVESWFRALKREVQRGRRARCTARRRPPPNDCM